MEPKVKIFFEKNGFLYTEIYCHICDFVEYQSYNYNWYINNMAL